MSECRRTVEGEFTRTQWMTVEFMPTYEGGGGRLIFSERRRDGTSGPSLFHFDVCAESADNLIEALAPLVASRSAGWPHVWVKAPGPHYREEEAGR